MILLVFPNSLLLVDATGFEPSECPLDIPTLSVPKKPMAVSHGLLECPLSAGKRLKFRLFRPWHLGFRRSSMKKLRRVFYHFFTTGRCNDPSSHIIVLRLNGEPVLVILKRVVYGFDIHHPFFHAIEYHVTMLLKKCEAIV